MKTRALAILCAACAGLALYYATFEIPGPVEKKQVQRLFDLDANTIVGIEIHGGALISLVKKGQVWWMEGEVNFPADQDEVARLIRGLVDIPVMAVVKEPREEFGLDRPVMEIVVRSSRGLYDLSLGSDSPTSAYCYASVKGRDRILLLPAGTKALFRKSLFSLTDKYLIHVNPWDVSGVKILKHGSVVEFVRDAKGMWHLAGGDPRKLSTKRIHDFFSDICRIKALSFPENQTVPESPAVTVQLASSRGVQQIRMWKEGQKAYALSDYQRGKAEISAPLIVAIPSSPEDLLDRSITPLEGDTAKKIVLQSIRETIFLNKGGQWYVRGKRVAAGAALDELVAALGSIEYVDEYLSVPRDAGPGSRLTVFPGHGGPPFDIMLYSQYYVKVGNRVFSINEGDMQGLQDSLRTLLNTRE